MSKTHHSNATSSSSSSSAVPDLAALFSSISASDFSSISSNLKMSPSESSRVQSALKDPAFMSLLADYAREIADPTLKAQNDEMLRQMEKEASINPPSQHKSTPSTRTTPSAPKGRGEEKQQMTFSELDLD